MAKVEFHPNPEFLLLGSTRLAAFVKSGLEQGVEIKRIALCSLALRAAGVLSLGRLYDEMVEAIVENQRPDGGWTDADGTAFCVSLLSVVTNDSECQRGAAAGLDFIRTHRKRGGGWGRYTRDQVRIPTTALVIALVPEVATEADWAWLRNEWNRDLERPVKLSYKGGFYLLAEKRNVEGTLPDLTIQFLERDQNDDGGFGPWKNHPIGSDPWSTGVVLWGLSRWIDHVDKSVVERALAWLEKTQLPSGYWPYHYLDEGTSYALIGAVSALKALQRL